jgi:dTDP-glucose 4,6-dehydratase
VCLKPWNREKTLGCFFATGGLGTVGRGLIQELTKRGHEVFACDLSHQPNEVGFSLRTDVAEPRYARADVGEFRQIERVFDKLGPFDYVYHCAAEFGRWNGEDFYEILWRTNAVGTKNILRLQEQQGFRLIHFSSSEVYSDWPEVMVENVMDDYEIKQMNDYAMTKWVNEMQIRNSADQYGTESVVVRLFNTYGPGEYYSPYRSVNCRFLYCALSNLPWTVFQGHARTSTFLADTVHTLANIVKNFKPGETYNIGGNVLHSIEELSSVVVEVTGCDPGLVQYREREPLTTGAKRVDVSKAIHDLGHQDTYNLRDGMSVTANWMRKVYEFGNGQAKVRQTSTLVQAD